MMWLSKLFVLKNIFIYLNKQCVSLNYFCFKKYFSFILRNKFYLFIKMILKKNTYLKLFLKKI